MCYIRDLVAYSGYSFEDLVDKILELEDDVGECDSEIELLQDIISELKQELKEKNNGTL